MPNTEHQLCRHFFLKPFQFSNRGVKHYCLIEWNRVPLTVATNKVIMVSSA